MHSVATFPLSRPAIAAQPRVGAIAFARGATLAIWLFMLVFPFIWIRSWQLYSEEQGVDFRNYYGIGFGACALAHLTLGIGAWISAPFNIMSTWSGRLFTIFCALELLLSPISLIPRQSAIYVVGTYAYYLVLYLYWSHSYRVTQRTTVLAGCVVIAWLFILAAKLGLSYGLAIGGLNRNMTGTAAVGAMACCLLSPRKSIRYGSIAAAFFMAFAVSSRGSIVALTVFLAAYYAIHKGSLRAVLHAGMALLAFYLLALMWPRLGHLVFDDILMLHDASRGIGSGFTGRVGAWKQGLEGFWEKPIFGYGFRAGSLTRDAYGGSHSGYIKLFVETGFVGGMLMLGAVLVETVRRYRLASRFRNLSASAAPGINVVETMRLNAVVFATLIMVLTIWVYEQLYINLGSIVSLVFWLMMVAPAYIDVQDNPRR